MDLDEFLGAFGNWRYSIYFQSFENKGKKMSVNWKLCPGNELLSTALCSRATCLHTMSATLQCSVCLMFMLGN